MLLTKEGREGGLVSYLLILFLLRKYRLWDIPLLTKKYVVFSPSKALHQLYFFLSFSMSLDTRVFSIRGCFFIFPQINVHIITWVCGSYKTYCFGVSQVLAQRCWHQYVCSPISVPNISTQSSYTIIFKGPWALACNLCLGIWGLSHNCNQKNYL